MRSNNTRYGVQGLSSITVGAVLMVYASGCGSGAGPLPVAQEISEGWARYRSVRVLNEVLCPRHLRRSAEVVRIREAKVKTDQITRRGRWVTQIS